MNLIASVMMKLMKHSMKFIIILITHFMMDFTEFLRRGNQIWRYGSINRQNSHNSKMTIWEP